MTPTLVGLTGYAGSGKDTAAEALVADGWRRDAFADRIRAGLLALDPIVDAVALPGGKVRHYRLAEYVDLHGWDRTKRDRPEVRDLLQRFGTEVGRRTFGPTVWLDLLMDDWYDTEQPATVITDVRFDNEARRIRREGGLIVEIRRPGVRPVNGHASDAGITFVVGDITVVNDGTVADLHARIREVVGRG